MFSVLHVTEIAVVWALRTNWLWKGNYPGGKTRRARLFQMKGNKAFSTTDHRIQSCKCQSWPHLSLTVVGPHTSYCASLILNFPKYNISGKSHQFPPPGIIVRILWAGCEALHELLVSFHVVVTVGQGLHPCPPGHGAVLLGKQESLRGLMG